MSAVLASNLQRVRQSQDKSREQVAAALGVSEHTYRKWEQDQREPSFDQLSQLAEYFGVSCEEFRQPVTEPRKPGRPPSADPKPRKKRGD